MIDVLVLDFCTEGVVVHEKDLTWFRKPLFLCLFPLEDFPSEVIFQDVRAR